MGSKERVEVQTVTQPRSHSACPLLSGTLGPHSGSELLDLLLKVNFRTFGV